MFAQYQYEIIAGIIFTVVVIVAFLMKSKNSSSKTEKDDKLTQEDAELQSEKKSQKLNARADILLNPEEETPQQKVVQESPEAKVAVEESEEEVLHGSEEGDFGVEAPQKQVAEIASQKTIKRRDVPNHDKITKQNFSEFSGERVLVAEDNLINQKVLIGLLAGSGIDIVIANDGQEALDILEEDSDFLMVLMDAHMPRVDGFEATRIIRANPRYDHILVVALSGDTAADDIRKMKDAGMAEQLEKPLRMDALYDILYAYTGMNQEQDANDNAEEGDFIEVVMTKNLDGDKGLETCGGDVAFYHEILDEFIQDYDNSNRKLEDLLENGELEHAGRVLLDIIGITANIGAKPLHDVSSMIKSSLSDTEGKSYLNFIPAYQTHLKNLIADIKAYK